MSETEVSPELKQELEQSIKLLKKTVKPSTALDEFKHIDLGLVAAEEKDTYMKALMTVKKCIEEGIISQEQFDIAVGIK